MTSWFIALRVGTRWELVNLNSGSILPLNKCANIWKEVQNAFPAAKIISFIPSGVDMDPKYEQTIDC